MPSAPCFVNFAIHYIFLFGWGDAHFSIVYTIHVWISSSYCFLALDYSVLLPYSRILSWKMPPPRPTPHTSIHFSIPTGLRLFRILSPSPASWDTVLHLYIFISHFIYVYPTAMKSNRTFVMITRKYFRIIVKILFICCQTPKRLHSWSIVLALVYACGYFVFRIANNVSFLLASV